MSKQFKQFDELGLRRGYRAGYQWAVSEILRLRALSRTPCTAECKTKTICEHLAAVDTLGIVEG